MCVLSPLFTWKSGEKQSIHSVTIVLLLRKKTKNKNTTGVKANTQSIDLKKFAVTEI